VEITHAKSKKREKKAGRFSPTNFIARLASLEYKIQNGSAISASNAFYEIKCRKGAAKSVYVARKSVRGEKRE
jgi:hypothetical protein